MTDLVFAGQTICSTGDNYVAFQYSPESPNLLSYAFHNVSGRRWKTIGTGQTTDTSETVYVQNSGGGHNCIFYKNSVANLFTVINGIKALWQANTIGTLTCDLGTFNNMRIESFKVLEIKYFGSNKQWGCIFEITFNK